MIVKITEKALSSFSCQWS